MNIASWYRQLAMSAYNNTEGGIDEPLHYIREEFTDRPLEKLESQNYDDEKGDPYVKELGNPDADTVDITSEGEEKEVGTGEREGNLRFFIDLTH